MTQSDSSIINAKDIGKADIGRKPFSDKILRLSAVACASIKDKDFDIPKAVSEAESGLKELGASGGIQEMLAAQMLSIHQLQQTSMALVNATIHDSTRQYFTNTAIRLANTFVQQANLLSRLQGNGGQKIVVEHVEVHNGGQAVVGNIGGGNPTGKVKR